MNSLIIKSCPRCGGHFIWSDYSGIMHKIPAKCVNAEYLSDAYCDFSCTAVRNSQIPQGIHYEWDGIRYWDKFQEEEQLFLFKKLKKQLTS